MTPAWRGQAKELVAGLYQAQAADKKTTAKPLSQKRQKLGNLFRFDMVRAVFAVVNGGSYFSFTDMTSKTSVCHCSHFCFSL